MNSPLNLCTRHSKIKKKVQNDLPSFLNEAMPLWITLCTASSTPFALQNCSVWRPSWLPRLHVTLKRLTGQQKLLNEKFDLELNTEQKYEKFIEYKYIFTEYKCKLLNTNIFLLNINVNYWIQIYFSWLQMWIIEYKYKLLNIGTIRQPYRVE